MSYVKVSIPKAKGNPGAPEPKDPNIILINTRDIETFPKRENGGVKIAEDIKLKDDAKAISLYATPSTINRFDTSEGDPDAKGFIQNLTFDHPGDSLEFNEFVQENLGEDFVIITKECATEKGVRLHGTPCNPMQFNAEGQDDNEAKKTTLTWASVQRSKFKAAHYYGEMPALADEGEPDEGSGSDGSGMP